jgi:hypothetical protein
MPSRRRAKVRRRAGAASRPAARARRRARPPATAPSPIPAEHALLALARDLAALTGAGAPAQAVACVAGAHGPHAPLSRDLVAAWHASRDDKTRALSLAWAREQVRLGLEDALARGRPAARPAEPLPADALAWLVLAGCEALAHEPPAAVGDRVRLLLALACGEPPAPP